jgi:[acyl-carrier-protein] S-malonyltransferase
LCKQASASTNSHVEIANFLSEDMFAVSGEVAGCDYVLAHAKKKPEFGAKLVRQLAVAGAFHTKFMDPAVEKLSKALSTTGFKAPKFQVYSNVTGQPHSFESPESIKRLLLDQVNQPVQLTTVFKNMSVCGFGKVFELGPGKSISPVLLRFDKSISVTPISV